MCPIRALAVSLSLSTLSALRLRLLSGFGCLCLSVSFLLPYPFPPCVADSARPLLGTLGVQPCCKRAEQPPCGHRRSLKGPGPRLSTQANGAVRGTEPIQTSRVVTDCLLASCPSRARAQATEDVGRESGWALGLALLGPGSLSAVDPRSPAMPHGRAWVTKGQALGRFGGGSACCFCTGRIPSLALSREGPGRSWFSSCRP